MINQTIYFQVTLLIEDINLDLNDMTIEPMVLPHNLGTFALLSLGCRN